MFLPDEEEAMSNMDPAVKMIHAVAKLGFQAAAVKTALDIGALIDNLKAELADAGGLEAELELTFPSERSPELQRRGVGLARLKNALRLAEAARDFVRVYDSVTTPPQKGVPDGTKPEA
jgi:hypothetical protein